MEAFAENIKSKVSRFQNCLSQANLSFHKFEDK